MEQLKQIISNIVQFKITQRLAVTQHASTIFNNSHNKRTFSPIVRRNKRKKDNEEVFVQDFEHNARGIENNKTKEFESNVIVQTLRNGFN